MRYKKKERDITSIKSLIAVKSLLVVLLTTTIISCGKPENQISGIRNKDEARTTEVKSSGEHEKVTVQLPTIQCNLCKKNITRALKKVDGVHEIDINVDGKIANIMIDKNKTDLAKVENAITGAGYQANDKKADPVAYEKLDNCCKVGGH